MSVMSPLEVNSMSKWLGTFAVLE